MEAILVKIFATALALSLVMTRPDAVKTEFDPVNDKAEVLKISDGLFLESGRAVADGDDAARDHGALYSRGR